LKDSHALVCGDFNFKDINWSLKESIIGDQSSTAFIECMNDCYLIQYVSENTRYREGNIPSLLDLVMTNESDMIDTIEYSSPLGKSDHVVINFIFNCYSEESSDSVNRYLYHKGDYDKLRDRLINQSWNTNQSVDEMWSCFTERIQHAVDECIPLSKSGPKQKKKPWVTGKALSAIKEKNRAWKKYKYCKNETNYNLYAEKRNIVTSECREAKCNFEKKLCENIKEDTKSFWKYIRSQCKTKSCVGDLEVEEGSTTSDNRVKVEIFNRFFCSVFNQEDTDSIPLLEEREFSDELQDIVVTPTLVEKKLLKLDPSKSPGEDQVHPRVLKESASIISSFLCSLFNKSLQHGQLPKAWKSAVVVPLHKKGSRSKAQNYRPVSLTSIICKIFESIIRDHLVLHMDSNNLFIEHQHGFRSQRSCVTQLLEVIDDWYEILDAGGCIDTIYLDFQKAFDTVPHCRLKNKLNSYGIRGNVLKWIEEFLNDRVQSVRIGNTLSEKSKVISGIPQGSVLGPILFLIYINDLPDIVKSSVKLFADDTKLYAEVMSSNDSEKIQEDLNSLAKWSDKWQLKFNADKCKSMHIGRGNPKQEYHMNSGNKEVTIKQTDCEKDLGVTFDERMKFDIHIANIVNKANQRLGLIRRSFEFMDKTMFLQLYKSLIRPTLEYATVIWSPWLKKDIVAIEQVQRRATRLIREIRDLSYENRLLSLGLPTLIYRRERADMLQLFKVMKGFDEVHLTSVHPQRFNSTRGHRMKLEKKHHRLKSTMNSFIPRSVNSWNSLPEDCIECETVNSFKSNLNNAWKHKANKFSYTF